MKFKTLEYVSGGRGASLESEIFLKQRHLRCESSVFLCFAIQKECLWQPGWNVTLWIYALKTLDARVVVGNAARHLVFVDFLGRWKKWWRNTKISLPWHWKNTPRTSSPPTPGPFGSV